MDCGTTYNHFVVLAMEVIQMTKQEAIDLLDNLIGMIEDNHGSDYDSAIRMAIDALEPQWIPCSERLPEVGVNVLVCDIDNDIYLTHMSPYKSFYDEFCDYIKNVVAWRPLPNPYNPYKEEEDGCVHQ